MAQATTQPQVYYDQNTGQYYYYNQNVLDINSTFKKLYTQTRTQSTPVTHTHTIFNRPTRTSLEINSSLC